MLSILLRQSKLIGSSAKFSRYAVGCSIRPQNCSQVISATQVPRVRTCTNSDIGAIYTHAFACMQVEGMAPHLKTPACSQGY